MVLQKITDNEPGPDNNKLANSFSRYKKFVKLKLLYPYEPLTPMFDVDLIWHTHQLCTQEYSDDTANFLGKVHLESCLST